MTLPITRKRWEETQRMCHGLLRQDVPASQLHMPFCFSTEEAIRQSTQWLLERLYEPYEDNESGITSCRVTGRSIAASGVPSAMKLLNEPINWGDLSAFVEKREGIWIVTLEEAQEGGCPTLRQYVESWLREWGWNLVEVRTTW